MNRRRILYSAGAIATLGLTGAATSCSTTLNSATIIADIEKACGILVPAAAVASAINAAVGMSARAIVDLFCTGLHSATAGKAGAAPASGSTVDFVVVVNGTHIPVHATYK